MVEFRVLGTLEVSRNGDPLRVPSRRQRALIARLLLSRGRVVPADVLVDAVWQDTPPRDARHALHTQISRTRTLLGPTVLVSRAPGYLLAVEPAAVDAERFETDAGRATPLLATDPAAAVVLLDRALGQWRGSAYTEFAGGFAQAAVVRLEELRLTAQELRGEALLAAGAVDRAVRELSALASDHPVRERPHALAMRALHLAGRQAEALAVYRRFRERLRDELGLDPSPQLQQVHAQVLRQAGPASDPPTTAAGHSFPVVGPPVAGPPVTSLVGRDRELRELTALVGTERLISLVGPGGVGKTRLAQELARRLADRTVWWVDLAPLRDPADVPYRVVDALGLPQPAGRELTEFIVAALRGASGLLIADNCEHVITPAAQLLAQIIGGCPGVVVLATSREPLAVAGERVLPVPPLPGPDGTGSDTEHQLRGLPAVILFEERLRAAGAPPLSPSEVHSAAEICRRVGGLPLAIELAAARARSLGVTTVADRPTLDLLTGVRRGEPDRHRSLRAVLDWSHDLLDSTERLLFRRLAVFAGPFTLADAEQVCAGAALEAGEVTAALAGLVEKSMVAGPERERYRLLDPTRAYAAERLGEHGEDRWLGAAHAEHFVRLAEQARGGMCTAQEVTWTSRVAVRIDDLRAVYRWAGGHDADLALRLAAALAVYARYHMRFELQDWAGTAAALPEAAGHPLRAAALGCAAGGAWARGEFDRAEQLAQEGLAAAPEGDPVAAEPLLVRGDVALLAGRLAAADEAYQQTARLAGAANPYTCCEALGGQALIRCYRGDLAGGLELAAAGERLARDVGAPGLRAMARYLAGECRLPSDPVAALDLLAQARALAAEAGALLVVGFATMSSVSARARATTDAAQACAAYREAIAHWQRTGNRVQQWLTLRNLVPMLVRAAHHELALVVAGALRSAPAQLPADVEVPEAQDLGAAVAQARAHLGDRRGQAADDRGGRLSLDELVAAVLGTIDQVAVDQVAVDQVAVDQVTVDPAGSSR